VAVVDVLGRQIRLLQDGLLPAGSHSVQWDGRDQQGANMPSGLYLASFTHAGVRRIIKMMLMK